MELKERIQEALEQGTVNISGFLRQIEEDRVSPAFIYDETICIFYLVGCYVTGELNRAIIFIQSLPASYRSKTFKNKELVNSILVGKFLYEKDYRKFFNIIKNSHWKESGNFIGLLNKRVAEEVAKLIKTKYRSISIDNACLMLGVSNEKYQEISEFLNAEIDNGHFIMRSETTRNKETRAISEDDISRITDLIMFFEEKNS